MQNEWIDYYEILDLPLNATEEEIKQRHRELLKKYHPDIYKGEDAHEKATEINEAYAVLSDVDKRARYDREYNQKMHEKTQKNNDYEEEPLDYEEVVNNYSEKEQKFAEKQAIKIIILEELKKVQEIIDAKNELLLQAYSDEISSEFYKTTLKQLITLVREYVTNLNELKQLADEQELFDEIFQIKEAIEQINEEMLDIPQSKEDAINYIEEEMQKDQFLRQIDGDISKIEAFVERIDQILVECYQGYIDKLNYNYIYEQTTIESQEYVRTLEFATILTEKWQLDQLSKKIKKLQMDLKIKIESFPEDYDVAVVYGKRSKIDVDIANLEKKGKELCKKFKKIGKITKKHPYKKMVINLCEYAFNLNKEYLDDVEKLKLQYIDYCETSCLTPTSLLEEILDFSKKSYKLYKKSYNITRDKLEKNCVRGKSKMKFVKSSETMTVLDELLSEITDLYNLEQLPELIKRAKDISAKYHVLRNINSKDPFTEFEESCVKNLNTEYDQIFQKLLEIYRIDKKKLIAFQSQYTDKAISYRNKMIITGVFTVPLLVVSPLIYYLTKNFLVNLILVSPAVGYTIYESVKFKIIDRLEIEEEKHRQKQLQKINYFDSKVGKIYYGHYY